MTASNILLCSAGRRVELVQAFQSAALLLLGPQSRVLTTDLRPELSAAAAVSDGALALPRVTATEYPARLLDLCRSEGIGLVIPTIDPELAVLARYRDDFATAGVAVVISDLELVRHCRDKRLTPGLFETIDLPSPALLSSDQLAFPCILKPLDGSCSQGIRILHSEEDLTPADRHQPRNIFQTLVPADWTEYSVDLYYTRQGHLRCLVPRQRLEVRGGEISKGITRRDGVYDWLKECLPRLQGARGCLTLQLFASPDQQQLLGIELNPRFGGGFPMSLAAGADYPQWLIREYLLGESLSGFFADWQSDLLMLRHDAMVVQPWCP